MIGADPEVFIKDDKGSIISAIGLIGGTKKEPIPVPQGGLQEDNVLAEFNIDPAGDCFTFIDNIQTVMRSLEEKLPKGYEIAIQSSHHFTEEYLLSQPPSALEFGCNSDMNAYTGQQNPAPDACATTLRTAGGHIHVSYPDPTPERSFEIVRNMDILLGIPSVCLDLDNERRTLYGKAGACRIKAYGVEYRTLSNFWLRDILTMQWAYEQTTRAIEGLWGWNVNPGLSDEEVQRIINEGDFNRAMEITENYLFTPEE